MLTDSHQDPPKKGGHLLPWPEIELPFPLRHNPHADAVRPQTRQWAISTGMLPTTEARTWWDHVNLTALEAWCFPNAPADRLLLIDKWLSMGILFDDQFDSTPLGHQPDATCRVMGLMMEAIENPPPLATERQNPFAHAVTDLLAHFSEMMSPSWQRRHRHHLTLWWGGVVQAVMHRVHGTDTMTFPQRLAVRRLTVGMHAFSDLFELACHWEIPPPLLALREIQRIRRIVTDITVYLNDLYSVERERIDGNDDNVLLAWEAEGATRHEARTAAADQTQALAEEFARLRTSVPDCVKAAGGSTTDLDGLDRWTTTCAHYLRGASHSQAIIPRYTDTGSHLAHDHHLGATTS
ncbi:terpene synthase family protein [Streptomyces sp. CA-256286]|uniref:terpene synthase family protein n=1 Tax=Streptomyces sp. CA-256286 TaxID=2801033 RepID=UPI001A993BBA|nr:terpene synthase family protein [Streptomyces sp. CA-256286]QTA37042.1 Pristinol synthase [Streptomyces sp. CA-256286]QTA37078.1 Pristinol synthase [Streptomyces sp. CA-256286]